MEVTPRRPRYTAAPPADSRSRGGGQPIESRTCSACGGRVDVMTLPEELDDGESVLVRIGACERCGRLFNDAAVAQLPESPAPHDRGPR